MEEDVERIAKDETIVENNLDIMDEKSGLV